MGNSTLEKVRAEALNLPESDRAELAHNLVASLDGPEDSDVEQAWNAEILRRLADIESDVANLIDRKELRRRLSAEDRAMRKVEVRRMRKFLARQKVTAPVEARARGLLDLSGFRAGIKAKGKATSRLVVEERRKARY